MVPRVLLTDALAQMFSRCASTKGSVNAFDFTTSEVLGQLTRKNKHNFYKSLMDGPVSPPG